MTKNTQKHNDDDGRVIAEMNVSGMPWFDSKADARHRLFGPGRHRGRGSRTDELAYMSRPAAMHVDKYSMRMLLRSMSPDVIAVDELGGESDIEALNQLVSCGIRILGSVHGTNADDLRRKMLPHAIERFVFIDHDEKGVRRYSIYDEAYRLLYSTVCGIGADKRLQQKKKGRYSDAV